eukprot:TRINITY_DN14721_c0_g4_i2.p1 TRINITY_DN14721_c0_g4~~TRINITY_DN14721_c0_g4_i2.p1  ORF type:complete len:665 (+),score=126.75 TRINITY_DN14721_c0_g4_i2:84-1997(+)
MVVRRGCSARSSRVRPSSALLVSVLAPLTAFVSSDVSPASTTSAWSQSAASEARALSAEFPSSSVATAFPPTGALLDASASASASGAASNVADAAADDDGASSGVAADADAAVNAAPEGSFASATAALTSGTLASDASAAASSASALAGEDGARSGPQKVEDPAVALQKALEQIETKEKQDEAARTRLPAPKLPETAVAPEPMESMASTTAAPERSAGGSTTTAAALADAGTNAALAGAQAAVGAVAAFTVKQATLNGGDCCRLGGSCSHCPAGDEPVLATRCGWSRRCRQAPPTTTAAPVPAPAPVRSSVPLPAPALAPAPAPESAALPAATPTPQLVARRMMLLFQEPVWNAVCDPTFQSVIRSALFAAFSHDTAGIDSCGAPLNLHVAGCAGWQPPDGRPVPSAAAVDPALQAASDASPAAAVAPPPWSSGRPGATEEAIMDWTTRCSSASAVDLLVNRTTAEAGANFSRRFTENVNKQTGRVYFPNLQDDVILQSGTNGCLADYLLCHGGYKLERETDTCLFPSGALYKRFAHCPSMLLFRSRWTQGLVAALSALVLLCCALSARSLCCTSDAAAKATRSRKMRQASSSSTLSSQGTARRSSQDSGSFSGTELEASATESEDSGDEESFVPLV